MDCRDALKQLLNAPQYKAKPTELIAKYVDIIRKQDLLIKELREMIQQLNNQLTIVQSNSNTTI